MVTSVTTNLFLGLITHVWMLPVAADVSRGMVCGILPVLIVDCGLLVLMAYNFTPVPPRPEVTVEH